MNRSALFAATVGALLLSMGTAAENITNLRTAEMWKPDQWNRAKGEIVPSANIPAEGKIEGLDESIQIKIDYSGKGFEFFSARPRKKQVKTIKGCQAWICVDIEGYYWMSNWNDKKGNGKIKIDGKEQKLEGGIDAAEDWYLWEWEKPEEWPEVRFNGITSHNWGNDKVPATVSLFVYDFQLIPEDPKAK